MYLSLLVRLILGLHILVLEVDCHKGSFSSPASSLRQACMYAVRGFVKISAC